MSDHSSESKSFVCSHCAVAFESHGKRDCHIENIHRRLVEVKFIDGTTKTIIRDHHGKFNCMCMLSYGNAKNLLRHIKNGCVEQEKHSEIAASTSKEQTATGR